MVRVKFEEDKFKEIESKLKVNSNVENVLGNRIYKGNPFDEDVSEAAVLEADVIEYDEAYHQIIKSKEASEYSRGEGVIVAVTDTGTDIKHVDLAENIWKNFGELGTDQNGQNKCENNIDDDENGKIDDCFGWNFTKENNKVIPSTSMREQHGTHVSGIIAAVENGEGTVGVAPDSKLMVLKFYGLAVDWSSTMVLDSYVYAVENGAKIINTSYRVDHLIDDEIYLSALEYAEDNNVLVVNSAGNSGKLDPDRLLLSNLLFVANTGTGYNRTCPTDKRVRSSNYGYGVDISAPGCKINSTIGDNKYQRQSGTSMSTPVISGALALIWSQNPDWTKEMVVSRLLSTSDDISSENDKEISKKMGTGRVNLLRALNGEKQRPISLEGFSKEFRTTDSYLTLRINGLADWSTLKDGTIQLYRLDDNVDLNRKDFERMIEKSSSFVPSFIKDADSLSYGSNSIKVAYRNGKLEAGNYLIKVKASLKDPFGNYLDGNSDGVSSADDHYYLMATLEDKDYLDPVLNSLEVQTSIVDKSDPLIMIDLDVEDDFSTIREIELDIRNTAYKSIFYKAKCNETCRNEDGKFTFKVDAKKLGITGSYYIQSIKITDNSEYARKTIYSADFYTTEYYSTADKSLKKIVVADSFFRLQGFKAKDTKSPQITAEPQLPSKIEAGQMLIASIFAEDKDSGIKTVSAKLEHIEGGKRISSRKDLFNGEKGPVQSIQFDVSISSKPGKYRLSSILLIDNEGNSNYMYCQKRNDKYYYSGSNIACPTIEIVSANKSEEFTSLQ